MVIQQLKLTLRLKQAPSDLIFIGAHIASLEYSVAEVSVRLDKFPNMVIDLAERVCHLQHQSVHGWKDVYDFFIKYQDRIIYGSDVIDGGEMSDEEIQSHIHELWERDWKYFTTSGTMTSPRVNGKFKSLNLPVEVIKKIYYKNVKHVYGI